MLKIKNQTDNSAELYISGTIVDDEDGTWLQEWTSNMDGYQFPAKLKRQLAELKDKDLTIYINSYGGSIPAGVAMAHMISRHKGATKAIVDGYCCSIATQLPTYWLELMTTVYFPMIDLIQEIGFLRYRLSLVMNSPLLSKI